MSHTKGEWEHGEFNYPADGKIGKCEIREGMGILAHVYLPAKKESGYKEGRANARLIAAAPDLLEACEKANCIIKTRQLVMKQCPNPELVDKTIFLLEVAIAKGKIEGGE